MARGRANPWIQVCMTLCFFLYVLAAWENWQVLLLIKVENLNTNWDENAEEAASRILTQKLKAFKDLQYVLAVRISVCCHKIRTKDLTAGRFLKLYTHFASRLYVETFINTLIKWLNMDLLKYQIFFSIYLVHQECVSSSLKIHRNVLFHLIETIWGHQNYLGRCPLISGFRHGLNWKL